MNLRWLYFFGALATASSACGSSEPLPCFPMGVTQAIDVRAIAVHLPRRTDSREPDAFASDIEGDGRYENLFGNVLAVIGALTTYFEDTVGAAPAPVVSALRGIASPECAVVAFAEDAALHARFDVSAGYYDSGPTRASATPVTIAIALPLVRGEAPIALDMHAARVRFTESPEQPGHFTGSVHGAVALADFNAKVKPAIARAFTAVLVDATRPESERDALRRAFGWDCKEGGLRDDDQFDLCELDEGILSYPLRADLRLYSASGAYDPLAFPPAKSEFNDHVSFGFGVDFAP